MTLVGVGHALADAFAFVGEDVPKTMGLHPGSFNRVPDYRMRAILATMRDKRLMAGGSAANTVKLAAQLGLDAHFIGQCGHDDAGQIFESELLGAGVKVNLARSDAPTGMCVTFLAPTLDRTVATFRSASGNLSPALVGESLLRAADVVVVEGYLLDEPEFLSDLLKRCQTLRKPVAFDTADGSLVDRHREALSEHWDASRIEYLFISEGDAATLTGVSAEEALDVLAPRVKHVVIRRPEGWLVRDGGVVSVPFAPASVVDASGAADAFQAGFFWGLERGWSAGAACRAGALVAQAIVEQPGTRVDEVRWSALTAQLNDLAKSL